jgi:hypothetical protein
MNRTIPWHIARFASCRPVSAGDSPRRRACEPCHALCPFTATTTLVLNSFGGMFIPTVRWCRPLIPLEPRGSAGPWTPGRACRAGGALRRGRALRTGRPLFALVSLRAGNGVVRGPAVFDTFGTRA